MEAITPHTHRVDKRELIQIIKKLKKPPNEHKARVPSPPPFFVTQDMLLRTKSLLRPTETPRRRVRRRRKRTEYEKMLNKQMKEIMQSREMIDNDDVYSDVIMFPCPREILHQRREREKQPPLPLPPHEPLPSPRPTEPLPQRPPLRRCKSCSMLP